MRLKLFFPVILIPMLAILGFILFSLYKIFNSDSAYDAYAVFRMVNALIEQNIGQSRMPLHDKAMYFPDHATLELQYSNIRDEVLGLTSRYELQEFRNFDSANSYILKPSDKWRVLPLVLLGNYVNAELAPVTARALRQCNGVRNAFISIIEPHTQIAAHTGNFMSVLRYHLCIKNPAPEKCHLVVNGTKVFWEEGKSFMFDDLFEHSVKNSSPHERIILFLDVVRVNMPWYLKLLDYLVHYLATFTPRYEDYVAQSKPRLKF